MGKNLKRERFPFEKWIKVKCPQCDNEIEFQSKVAKQKVNVEIEGHNHQVPVFNCPICGNCITSNMWEDH